ncbi:hypothetical protein [Sediminicola arcticus]|uniref:Secreted protein n=1 Tax=Sediminicola arcticus TaxID=1574308 RepID=A0ABV2SPT0_9FLAO
MAVSIWSYSPISAVLYKFIIKLIPAHCLSIPLCSMSDKALHKNVLDTIPVGCPHHCASPAFPECFLEREHFIYTATL